MTLNSTLKFGFYNLIFFARTVLLYWIPPSFLLAQKGHLIV